MIVHVTFAGVYILQKDAHRWLQWAFEFDFMKHGMDGVNHAIFGLNRTKLECEEMYCHFRNPETFLKMIDEPKPLLEVFQAFVTIFVFLHILTFYNMNKRLKRLH
jgi:ATP-binding cassette, subfamily G (WHITE), member 1